MAEDDEEVDMEDLFGDDSGDDEGAPTDQPSSSSLKLTVSARAADEAVADASAADKAAADAAVADEIDELFGDDDDEEGGGEEQGKDEDEDEDEEEEEEEEVKPRVTERKSLVAGNEGADGDLLGLSDDADLLRVGPVGAVPDGEVAAQGEAWYVDKRVPLPAALAPPDADVYVLKVPPSLSFEPTPFDPSVVDAEELKRAGPLCVRWRVGADGAPESNAKLITWSDGSMHLRVGKALFALTRQARRDAVPNSQFLAVQTKLHAPSGERLLATVAPVTGRLIVTSTGKLRGQDVMARLGHVLGEQGRRKTTRRGTRDVDSRAVQKQRAKLQKELDAQARRQRSGKLRKSRKRARGERAELDADFLEGGMDGSDEDDEGEHGYEGITRDLDAYDDDTERKRSARLRGIKDADEEDEEEEEEEEEDDEEEEEEEEDDKELKALFGGWGDDDDEDDDEDEEVVVHKRKKAKEEK